MCDLSQKNTQIHKQLPNLNINRTSGAQPENSLKSIDFTGPGRGNLMNLGDLHCLLLAKTQSEIMAFLIIWERPINLMLLCPAGVV